MPPNFAENRKHCQLEGSPVIHQGMTVQLFVPVLCAGVIVQGSLLPCHPSPHPHPTSPAEQSRLGLCLITSGGSMARLCWGQVFIYLSWFFGVGRLRNVECCNIGEGGWRSERELALLPCPSLSPLCPWRLPWLPSAPQSPCQARLNIPLSL